VLDRRRKIVNGALHRREPSSIALSSARSHSKRDALASAPDSVVQRLLEMGLLSTTTAGTLAPSPLASSPLSPPISLTQVKKKMQCAMQQ
jgi:hypothetical protein